LSLLWFTGQRIEETSDALDEQIKVYVVYAILLYNIVNTVWDG